MLNAQTDYVYQKQYLRILMEIEHEVSEEYKH